MPDPIYVVGDIHGQSEQLFAALDLIRADGGPDAEIVFLGDLVDRGPDSSGVIRHLMRGLEEGRRWHVLKGNHDRMFCRYFRQRVLHDPRVKSGVDWLDLRLGGRTTLRSYDPTISEDTPESEVWARSRTAVPEAHVAFLESTLPFLEREELLFVHAGIRPGVGLADQQEDDLIWIREPFLSDDRTHPWLIVHGHTALEVPHNYGNRVNLDGGAGYGRPLIPAVFEGTDCWLLTEKGRLSLPG